MKKVDIVRDLKLATKQMKFAADFNDLYGYPFSEVQKFAQKDSEVNDLLLQYNEMINLYEQKIYLNGIKDGKFGTILEKRLEKTGFIGVSKLELRGALPDEIINNIKDFFNDNTEV